MMKLALALCVFIALFVLIQGQEGSTFAAEDNGLLRDTHKFQLLNSDEITKLEKQPGSTPVVPQTTVPPSERNKALNGKPGPSPGMGSNSAPIKVYIWSDFQCPNCRRVIEPMKYLVRKYPDQVQVIFKQNPLPSHKKAYDAARAALAASRQGKFWEYHEVLFANMGKLDVNYLLDYARDMGLDMVQFRVDMDSKSVKNQIEYELEIAKKFEITGTPGFIINGQKVVGWASYQYVEQIVERGIKGGKIGECAVDGYTC